MSAEPNDLDPSAVTQMPEPRYILAGYLRFVESDKPGVVAEVISPSVTGVAVDSDVPVFRRLNDDGSTTTKAALAAHDDPTAEPDQWLNLFGHLLKRITKHYDHVCLDCGPAEDFLRNDIEQARLALADHAAFLAGR